MIDDDDCANDNIHPNPEMNRDWQYELRLKVYRRMNAWMTGCRNNSAVLHRLLTGKVGFYAATQTQMNLEEVQTCKMLLGEHGYAIFKALEARRAK